MQSDVDEQDKTTDVSLYFGLEQQRWFASFLMNVDCTIDCNG